MAEEIQKKKISELPSAVYLSDADVMPVVQGNGSSEATKKVDIGLVSSTIAESKSFSNLDTTSKTLVGAINEVNSSLGNVPSADEISYDNTSSGLSASDVQGAIDEIAQGGSGGSTVTVTQIQSTGTKIATITVDSVDTDLYSPNGGGGASAFEDLTDVDIDSATLANGQVPVYNSNSAKWENGTISGGSGHTILDNTGTSLTQRTNLQFIGAYSEDNSADDTTEVNVIREMTKAEFALLSADEKTGLINITDEISGGLKYVKETLYSNIDESNWSAQSSGATLTLTDNILDYDEVYFESAFWEGNNTIGKKLTHFVTSMVDHNTIQIAYEKYGSATYDGMFDVCPVLLSAGTLYTFGLSMQVPTTTSLKIQSKYVGGWNSNSWGITRIVGIKYLSDSEHTYSEDEQIVGTWIDGSTLYEKTISTSNSSVDLTSLGIGTLAKIEGIIQHTNGKVTPISYESAASDWAVPVYDVSSKILSLAGYGTSQGGTWVLSIRYTKSV